MKTYYEAPVMVAEFKNITFDDNGNITYERKNIVTEENVEFYFNFLSVLIRRDTKFPITVEEEVHDLFLYDVLVNKENVPSTLKYQYVDPLKLTKIKTMDEEEKTIKLEKPKQKRKIFSFKCR